LRERVRVRGERKKAAGEVTPSDASHFPLTPALSRKRRGGTVREVLRLLLR
jgi:hypothetical protein